MITDEQGLDAWRKARDHSIGVCLNTDYRRNLITRLYHIRDRYKEEGFDMLMVMKSDAEEEVWIIHKELYMKPTLSPAIKPMTDADLDSL